MYPTMREAVAFHLAGDKEWSSSFHQLCEIADAGSPDAAGTVRYMGFAYAAGLAGGPALTLTRKQLRFDAQTLELVDARRREWGVTFNAAVQRMLRESGS